ncbi:MAG: hypothetical protein H6742_02560 [Alphaproteobacteria bacterium]|nr:hypothetical protein [Alphaproteobacteria bacterium]
MTEPLLETPLQTAWPALVAVPLWLLALLASARRLRPDRRLQLGLLGVFVLALVVRLWVVPAWARHEFDGHEAEYWDLFRGERPLSRGGTILYPAMQWFWWAAGRVLPHDPRVPVVLMSLVGALSSVVTGATVGRLVGPRGAVLAGIVAGLVVAVHPTHAAWSSSAYNVVLPHFFAGVALWGAAVVGDLRAASALWERLALGALIGLSGALVLATRLDVGVLGLAAVLLLLRGGGLSWRERTALVPGLVVGALLTAAAVRPLLFPGEVPGAGERALAWHINIGLLDYHAPFHTLPALTLVVLGTALAARRWPVATLALFGVSVLNHVLLATFDDFGDRHALTSLWGIAWALGAGAAAVPGQARRLSIAVAAGGVLVSASGLVDLRQTFYAEDGAWLRHLDDDPVVSELPQYGPQYVAVLIAPEGHCGWVAEDYRVAREPPLSHFNLLDPAEAESLRGDNGCLRWCEDRQDWIWSSRGVRDRAIRLRHLYELQPVGVVVDRELGYACVVQQVGRRLR